MDHKNNHEEEEDDESIVKEIDHKNNHEEEEDDESILCRELQGTILLTFKKTYLNGQDDAKKAMNEKEDNSPKNELDEEGVAKNKEVSSTFKNLPQAVQERLEDEDLLCPGFYIPTTSTGCYKFKDSGVCVGSIDSLFERITYISEDSDEEEFNARYDEFLSLIKEELEKRKKMNQNSTDSSDSK